ncbi:MAG: ROK family protein [Planctomycetes bacterium]|nr:ROK family protein [Planctomycetota bacterium]
MKRTTWRFPPSWVAGGGAATDAAYRLDWTTALDTNGSAVATLLPFTAGSTLTNAVELTLSQHVPDIIDEGYDVSLQLSATELPDSGLVSQRLGEVHSVLCASPAYLKERGTPRTVRDLDGHACLQIVTPVFPRDRWHLDGPDGPETFDLPLPDFQVNIADALGDEIGLPVHLLSDIQAATWAEYGAFHPRPGRFVHLRLGTGAGICAILNGQLEAQDAARRTHHPLLVVDAAQTAAECPCGLRGCLEGFVAAPALVARMSDHLDSRDLRELQAHYDTGDAFALAIIDLAADALAVALENVIRAYEADVVSVGGGVIMALPSLLDRAVEAYGERQDADRSRKGSSIRAARLGDDAGVIGAARLAAKSLVDSTLRYRQH